MSLESAPLEQPPTPADYEIFVAEIPSPGETAAQYARVVDELDLAMPPGLDLGTVLARMSVPMQHAVRAQYGLFPYSRRHSAQELGRMFAGHWDGRADLASEATSSLRAARYYKLDAEGADAKTETLEDIARLTAAYADTKPEVIPIVRKFYGLPPYLPLRPVAELAAQHNLRPDTFRNQARRALTRLQQLRDNQGPNAHIIELCRDRDLGWYASLLLTLRPLETRGAWVSILSADLARGAVYSMTTIKSAESHRRNARASGSYERRDTLSSRAPEERTEALAFQRQQLYERISTPEAREAILHELCARADQLTDEDAADLTHIVELGNAALQELRDSNRKLVLFVANNLKSPFARSLAAGEEGLARAVRNYNPAFGYSLASYTVKCISDAIHKHNERRLATRKNITVHGLRQLRQLESAEGELTQELQREPTPEQLATRSGLPLHRVHYLQVATKGTAAVSLVKRQDSYGKGVGRTHHEIVEHRNYNQEDRDLSTQQARALHAAFESAQLTTAEIDTLFALSGYSPYDQELSVEELAARRGVDPATIKKQNSSAKRKLTASPAALNSLSAYLRN